MPQVVRYLETQKGNCGIIHCGSRKKVEMATEKQKITVFALRAIIMQAYTDERAYVQQLSNVMIFRLRSRLVGLSVWAPINPMATLCGALLDIPRNIESTE